MRGARCIGVSGRRTKAPSALLLAAAACVGAGATAPATLASSAATVTSSWPMYHRNPARTGNDPNEPSFASLRLAWTAGPVDGAVYAEPLVAGGAVFVATENNSVYAFDVTTGQQRWRAMLGPPRTSNFPCGNIMPLGITSTPIVSGSYLYVVGEVEQPAGTYGWHLAKVSTSTGALIYDTDITPVGMTANTQQQRAALAISNGNIVVGWGGLAGDCGSYHGWVETVAKSTGVRVAQWHDTANDNQGAVWGASGPAIDSQGNIYVTTGNGSTTDISSYDYSDSVVKLSPSLAVLSFFAPGPPQQWTSLNSSDTDLGSVGPALFRNGLLFAIGKGGRGYLLDRAQLPDDSNPGGGENYSAQVCHATRDAAFGGTAFAAGTVYVPCSDGIVAVHVDSSTSFHVVWYATSGSSAPIVAGGRVWTLQSSGGTSLYGLDPSTGALSTTLTLPAATEHFATPSSSDGELFVAAGTTVCAFAPAA